MLSAVMSIASCSYASFGNTYVVTSVCITCCSYKLFASMNVMMHLPAPKDQSIHSVVQPVHFLGWQGDRYMHGLLSITGV